MREEANPLLAATSFQIIAESGKIPPLAFSPGETRLLVLIGGQNSVSHGMQEEQEISLSMLK